MEKRWIRLWLQIWDSKWVQKPFTYLDAWLWLCSHANWKDGVINWENQIINVKRGEILTSQMKLAKTWGWSQKKVRGWLQRATKFQDITYRTSSKWTKISICKYEGWNSMGQTQDLQKNNRGLTEDDNSRSKEVKEGKELNTLSVSKKPETDSRVKKLLSFWGEEFKKRFNVTYPASFGKEGKLLKDALALYDWKVKSFMDAFWLEFVDNGNDVLGKRRPTIGVFYSKIPELIVLYEDSQQKKYEYEKEDMEWVKH